MSDNDKVKHAVEKNAERATGLLDEAKERFSDFADDARARGEKLIARAKDRGNELWDDAQEQGKDTWKDITTVIRKNPGAAVGCALVAGAVLYALFGRRED